VAEAVGRLAVVACPMLPADDRQWIEEIRARHDPQASRIAAPVTLVFPTNVAEGPLVAHVRAVLQGSGPIHVMLRRAAVAPDAIGGGYHAFLPVEEGSRELLAVHEELYAGLLAARRLAAIPFAPHITIGAHPKRGECERIARLLNDEGRIVRASIQSVDVIEVDGSRVRTVAEISLRVGSDRGAATAGNT
jgi:2'-5' RNA ligase